MFLSEVALHVVFGEDLSSDLAREGEADQQDLKGYRDRNDQDIPIIRSDRERERPGQGVGQMINMHTLLHFRMMLVRYISFDQKIKKLIER